MAGRGNPTIPAEVVFMKDFNWYNLSVVCGHVPPKYLGSCKQLFEANLRLQNLIGFKRKFV